MSIPVSVIIVTRDEERRIAGCLKALNEFAEIVVVDSNSRDRTATLAREQGARVVEFSWNGQYPKKRQWVLDTVPLAHDWVLWIDADEIVTRDLVREISVLMKDGPSCDGYFIEGQYVMEGRRLRFGQRNSKLVLFNRHRFQFPVIDDLDIPGMGEIEGHYQPVARPGAVAKIGQLRAVLLHHAYDDLRAWIFRHEKYARWEAGMNQRAAWPDDPVAWRQSCKSMLRRSRLRPELMFLVSYVLRLGLLDGKAGRKFALSRYHYYKKIQELEHQLGHKKTGTES